MPFLNYGGHRQSAMGWMSWAQHQNLLYICKSELVELSLVLIYSSPKNSILEFNAESNFFWSFLAFFQEYS